MDTCMYKNVCAVYVYMYVCIYTQMLLKNISKTFMLFKILKYIKYSPAMKFSDTEMIKLKKKKIGLNPKT